MEGVEKKKILISLVSSVLVLIGIAFLLYRDPPKKVEKATEKEEIKKVDRIRVNLEIDNQIKPVTVTAKIDEGSTMLELLNTLRKNESITYETTNYLTGEVVDNINDLEASESKGLVWRLFIDGVESTENVTKIIIKKDTVYKWVYGPKIGLDKK